MQEDAHPEDEERFVRHLDALGVPHAFAPPPRREFGLDRNTEEGALIAFSGALRPDKPIHRVVAWVLLVTFGFPVLAVMLHLTEGAFGLLVR